MKLLIPLLLLATNTFAGGGPPRPWAPWFLPQCKTGGLAYDGAYGVVGSFTNQDLSGNNKDMFATSHTPSQAANYRNGWPAVLYTNNTMWLTNTGYTLTNDNTIMVVAKCWLTNQAQLFLVCWQSNFQAYKINSGEIPTVFTSSPAATNTGTAWTGVTTNWFCGVLYNSNGTMFYRTNGVSAGGTSGAPNNGSITNMPANCIGNVLNPNIFLVADFGDLIVFSPNINNTQSLTNAEKWASTRWNLGY